MKLTREELRLYRRMRDRAARLEPAMRKAYLDALAEIVRGIKPGELVKAINSGQLDRLGPDSVLDRGAAKLSAAHQSMVADAVRAMGADLPGAAGAFDVLNPNVIDAVQKLNTKVVRGLKDEVRETVRGVVERGLEQGKAPAAIARQIRESVGLAPNQAEAVDNFERMLRERDLGALTRKLRDHRFDGTLRKALGKDGAGLTEAQIKTMTDAYRRRYIAHNAETHARTATLDALKQGQKLSVEQAVEAGYLDGDRMRKRWSTVGDSKVRDEHVAMEGEDVAWDALYSNMEDVPGESTYNCRCRSVFYQAREPNQPGAA